MVVASTGLDVLTHAIESYTAAPYDSRPRPERPILRPAFQGANPASDIWTLQAMRMLASYLVRAVEDADDIEARTAMAFAASFAGVGFSNAGTTIPHAMSYGVSGMVREYRAPGYPQDRPLVPHGIAVVLNAPAALRFTARACPGRHLLAAEALGADISRAKPEDAGRVVADVVIGFMKRLRMPNGLAAIGYTSADIPALVEGTLPQQRLLSSPPSSRGGRPGRHIRRRYEILVRVRAIIGVQRPLHRRSRDPSRLTSGGCPGLPARRGATLALWPPAAIIGVRRRTRPRAIVLPITRRDSRSSFSAG